MKSIDKERTEAGVYEGSESLKPWANIVKRLTSNKTIDKLERVAEGMLIEKSEIGGEVEESNYESRGKRRMVLLNLMEERQE